MSRIKLFQDLFRGREDAYGFGNGQCVKQFVTEALIEQHLRGELRIGIYNFSPDIEGGTAIYWSCKDFDNHPDENGNKPRNDEEVFHDVINIQRTCQELGLRTYIEASKSEGAYHLWEFYAEPIQGKLARNLASLVIMKAGVAECEIFPKQEAIFPRKDEDGNILVDKKGNPEWGFGNYVNLPLNGEELVERGRTVFLNPDDDFKPYADQFEFLSKVHRHTRAEIEEAFGKLATESEVDENSDLVNIQTIAKKERDTLIKTTKSPSNTTRPGDDFNLRGNHQELLGKYGWTLVLSRGNVEYWKRPNKQGDGWSANWNYIPRRFYVFSDKAAPLQEEQMYDLFSLYAHLEHDGDFGAAAKVLAAQGYGTQKRRGETSSRSDKGTIIDVDKAHDDSIPDEVLDAMAGKEEVVRKSAQDILSEINLLNEPTPEKNQKRLWDFVTDASYWTPTELGRFCDDLNIEYNVTKTWLRGWKRAVITEKQKRKTQEQKLITDEKPTIVVTNRFMREVTDDIILAINRINSQKPFLFVRSGMPTRVELDENDNAIAKPLTVSAARGIMERAANFVSETDIEGEILQSPVNPPLDNVNDFLSLGGFPNLPPLVGISTAPIVAPDGTICVDEGYHPEIRYFYYAKQKLEIGDITPTSENVEEAKRFILDELLCDFPFANQASRANTVALMLNPFVRPLIQGATPLHTIDASTPGTGKTLLADITSMAFIPSGPPIMTAGRDDDEWRKRITAKLMNAPSHILIDNVKIKLTSGDLSAALTAYEWEDRILGQSATIRLPVKCTWIVTGNNLELSDEIARRSVWIRLEPKVERPWERRGFKHEDLRGWVRKHRGEIVTALLTLIRKWLADGRPESDVILGGYEEWVKIIGGILKAVGIDGFLENANELYEQLDADRMAWVEFFSVWAEKYGAYDEESGSWGAYIETESGLLIWEKRDSGEAVGTKELFSLASHFDDNPNEGLGILDAYLGSKNEQARRVNLSRQLQKRKDRVFGGYQLEILSTKRKKATLYRLTKSVGVSGQFRYTQQEASRSEGLENHGVSGVSKTTQCSSGVKTYYTNTLLSSDRFNGPRDGAGIDTPDTPERSNDAPKNSRDAELEDGVSKFPRYTKKSEDEEIESEDREVFII